MICGPNNFIETEKERNHQTNKRRKAELRLENDPPNIPSHDIGLGSKFLDMTSKAQAKGNKK